MGYSFLVFCRASAFNFLLDLLSSAMGKYCKALHDRHVEKTCTKGKKGLQKKSDASFPPIPIWALLLVSEWDF